MTISSTNRVAGPFTGTGTQATFPFAFKVFEAADLDVVTLDTTSGVITPLALTTDFSVALNADQDTSPGGSITLTAGNLASGLTLTITTDMAELQQVKLINAGGFYPSVINDALDKLIILVQQLQVQLGRALQVPFGDESTMELPAPSLRAGTVIMFDGAGNLQLVPIAGGTSIVPGAQGAAGAVNGVNKVFTFTAPAGPTPSILAFAGGIFLTPTTDYGAPIYVSGTTWQITLTNAPNNGPITILMLG